MGQVGGKQIGIPLMTGSIGMIANKEVLAKAGVDKMPATIDEFKAALMAVRDKVPNSVPYAMATKNNNSIILDYMIWIWAYGGQIIDERGQGEGRLARRQAGAGLHGGPDEGPPRRSRDRPARLPPPARPGRDRLLLRRAAGPRLHLRNFSGQGEAFDAAIAPVKTPVLKAGDTPRSIEWGHVLIAFAADGKLSKDAPAAKWIVLHHVGRRADRLHARPERAASDEVRAPIGRREEGRVPRRLGRGRRRAAAQRDRRVDQRGRADAPSSARKCRPRMLGPEDRRRGGRGDAEAPGSRDGEPEEGRLIRAALARAVAPARPRR